jgi:hypothetical protein
LSAIAQQGLGLAADAGSIVFHNKAGNRLRLLFGMVIAFGCASPACTKAVLSGLKPMTCVIWSVTQNGNSWLPVWIGNACRLSLMPVGMYIISLFKIF